MVTTAERVSTREFGWTPEITPPPEKWTPRKICPNGYGYTLHNYDVVFLRQEGVRGSKQAVLDGDWEIVARVPLLAVESMAHYMSEMILEDYRRLQLEDYHRRLQGGL